MLKPNRYQIDIIEKAKLGENMLIDAKAGTGKTSTLKMIYQNMPLNKKQNCIFLAFNNHIKQAMENKGLPAKTTHAIGFSLMREHFNSKLNQNKIKQCFKEASKNVRFAYKFQYECITVCSFLKNKGITSSLSNYHINNPSAQMITKSILKDALLNAGFDGSNHKPLKYEEYVEQMFNFINQMLHLCSKDKDEIDFDDMIYLPFLLKLKTAPYKLILVDEVQDLNILQHQLIENMTDQTTQIIACGDDRQCCYAFRGADVNGMKKLKDRFSLITMPLYECFRCGQKIVRESQLIVPEIEPCSKNEQGTIIKEHMIDIKKLTRNDMVICRNNAPLFKIAFDMLKEKLPFNFYGANITKQIEYALEEIPTFSEYISLRSSNNTIDYNNLANAWLESKKSFCLSVRQSPSLYIEIHDIIMTIMKNLNGWKPELMKQTINKIGENKSENAPTLSTIHRSKGLESENVYILDVDLIGKRASNIDDIKIEKNLKYIAITRAIKTLHYSTYQ